MTDTNAAITQLQQQQALMTAALKSLLEGRFIGGLDSIEAYLYALDPTLTGTLDPDPPVSESQIEGYAPPKA